MNADHGILRSGQIVNPKRADDFAHAALASITELFEDHAPLSARWLPDNRNEAISLLKKLRGVGLKVAALSHAALAVIQTVDDT